MKLHELLNVTFSKVAIVSFDGVKLFTGLKRELKPLPIYEEIWSLEVIHISTNNDIIEIRVK